MIINKTKFLEFKKAKSPQNHDWFYVKRTNDKIHFDSAVCITTLIKSDDNKYSILLLKTKRPPIYAENKAKFCIESPAGLIADENIDEELQDCIKKELKEETGYVADKIFIELKNASSSSGLTSETLTFVTAIVKDKQIATPVSDGGIIVDRLIIPVDKIDEYISNLDKEMYSVATACICGIYYALKRIK